MMLRIDGPGCTLVLAAPAGSPTRLALELESDGRGAAVELQLDDVRQLADELRQWLDSYPTAAPAPRLQPSRAAMPGTCDTCGVRPGEPCEAPDGRHLRRSHNGRRRAAR